MRQIATTTVIGLFIALAMTQTWAIAEQTGPQPPTILGPAGGFLGAMGDLFLVAMPNGDVDLIFGRTTASGTEVARKRSKDKGHTWSEPETVYPMTKQNLGTPLPMLAKDGNLQFFWLTERHTGTQNSPGVDYFIDLWNSHSPLTSFQWSEPKQAFEGYIGSLLGMTQLKSGRIVVPFAYWLAGVPAGPPVGNNVITTVYSDDGGDTWQQSSAKLTTPCYPNYNGESLGAVEPTVIQMKDGRVWMPIRTQTGSLYESFSNDGVNWSKATRSRFHSSDSPAGLVRLPDGRIVMFWNNCENTSPVNGQGVYTNRDALHAAISSDEGETWKGYREVYLDPFRNDPPPKQHDRGTAYPYPVATPDGTVLLITGQGDGRRNILSVDPNWLEETRAEDDFSHGLGGWSVFKSFGTPENWWRDRVQGPELVDHPTKSGAKALHVRRPDEKDGDGAVWNFPIGYRGKVEVSLQLLADFKGGSIALADRFIQPTDSVGESQNLFLLTIGSDGRLPDGSTLTPGDWYTLALNWDIETKRCLVTLNDRPAGQLAMLGDDPNTDGVCYLRFRSTASEADNAGMLIERVRADVTVPEPSAMILLGIGMLGLLGFRRRVRHADNDERFRVFMVRTAEPTDFRNRNDLRLMVSDLTQ